MKTFSELLQILGCPVSNVMKHKALHGGYGSQASLL